MSEIVNDPTDDRDFRQFARAFDQPMAPSASFADTLRRQAITSAPPATARAQVTTTPRVASNAGTVRFENRKPYRIGLSILEIAAALLLISALTLSAFVIYSVGRPTGSDPETSGRLSQAIGSPATSQPVHSTNWGGDEGRSQYYGVAPIDTGETPNDLQVGDKDTTTVGPGLIAGDSWYGWTVRDSGDAFLRVNVETGEQIWSQPYRTWGTLASDGERIFAFLIDASETPTPVPAAIDMQTGEIAWRGPALHPFATSFPAEDLIVLEGDGATPAAGAPSVEGERIFIDLTSEQRGAVIAGDTVYFTDGLATTVALDAAGGSERWRDDRSDQFPTVFGYGEEIQTPMAGTVVANDRYVLVMLPDASIVSLDPATGEERGRSYTGGFTDSNRIILGMSLRGDRLVVPTVSSFVFEDEGALGNSAVTVLDAGSLDVLVTSDLIEGPAGFEFVVTDTAAFLLTLNEQDVPELVEIDLATGSLSEPFGTGQLVSPVRLSGAGDTLVAAMSSGTVLYFSMETHELIERHGVARQQPATLVGGPVQVVDGRPVAVWKIGPNDPVPQAPVATPVP